MWPASMKLMINDNNPLVFMWAIPLMIQNGSTCVFLEIMLSPIFFPFSSFLCHCLCVFLFFFSPLSFCGCQERVSGCVFRGIVVRAMRRTSLYFVVMATLATWYPLHVRIKHPISWYFTRSCTHSFLWVVSKPIYVLSRLVWTTSAHTVLSNLHRGVNLKAYVWIHTISRHLTWACMPCIT